MPTAAPFLGVALAAALALGSMATGAAGAVPVRAASEAELGKYPWLTPEDAVRPLVDVFSPPPGFSRVALADDTFGAWLRTLPLRAADAPVLRFDGAVLHRAGDSRIAGVVEIDLGTRDLQQCADFIIRFHAEWLWSLGRQRAITYRFTSGDEASWTAYAAGQRARVRGSKVTWERRAEPARDRATFRRYLDLVFMYAGTRSIERDGARVARADLAPGDFFVLGGGPGHAVLVLDVATHPDGRKVALIGQGFLPARDFHVLAGPHGPWFSLDENAVTTPMWAPFPWSSLRRFP